MYDVVIIGSGIAGLYAGYKLQDLSSNLSNSSKILIVESQDRIGGRIDTIYETVDGSSISYEAGAARFSDRHKLLMGLINEFGYETSPIPSEKYYIHVPSDNKSSKKSLSNKKSLLVKNIISNKDQYYTKKYQRLLKQLLNNNGKSPSELRKITFREYSNEVIGKEDTNFLIAYFGYDSDFIIQNAYDAIRLFKLDFVDGIQYYTLKNGLSQLTNKLADIYKENGGEIMLKSQFQGYTYDSKKKSFQLQLESYVDNGGKGNSSKGGKNNSISCKRLILATPGSTIKYIFRDTPLSPLVNSIDSVPLIRIYAIYPKENGKVWFDGMPKITTNNPMRYIIPVDYETGLIMIVYADGLYANAWLASEIRNRLEKDLRDNLAKVFPYMRIPDPTYLETYYWNGGVHYWKPGIDSQQLYKEIMMPISGVPLYICGESYSMRQAWIEGALESTEDVIKLINGNTRGGAKNKNKNKNKNKKFTMKEIQKHNTPKSGWILLHGNVYDVTKWIAIHPGGNIILGCLGKDATKLFESIGHSNFAKEKLKSYKIGVLA